MSELPSFSLEVSSNPYPSRNEGKVSALLTASFTGSSDGNPVGHGIAEVILLDRSGSMALPPVKLLTAQRAACAALDSLPFGTPFAVVEGTNVAGMVYPREPKLVPLTVTALESAKKAVRALTPTRGGTVISTWLVKARELLENQRDRICHVTLLTDGRNEHEKAGLGRVIEACRGVLICDARGIGRDWDPDELLRITEALHGTVPALANVDDLVEDFRAIVGGIVSKSVPELTLRVRCGRGVTLAGAWQNSPVKLDIAGHATQVTPTTTDYAMGPWAEEARDYIFAFTAEPDAVPKGATHRVASFELLAQGSALGVRTFVDVQWHDGPARATEFPVGLIEEYRHKQDLLTELVREGCRAFVVDRAAALEPWGRAAALAHQLGNSEMMERLRRVVRIDDPAMGSVKLLPDVKKEHVLQLQMGATVSSPIRDMGDYGLVAQRSSSRLPQDKALVRSEGESPFCPRCRWQSPVNEPRYCERCGHIFAEGTA